MPDVAAYKKEYTEKYIEMVNDFSKKLANKKRSEGEVKEILVLLIEGHRTIETQLGVRYSIELGAERDMNNAIRTNATKKSTH